MSLDSHSSDEKDKKNNINYIENLIDLLFYEKDLYTEDDFNVNNDEKN